MRILGYILIWDFQIIFKDKLKKNEYAKCL